MNPDPTPLDLAKTAYDGFAEGDMQPLFSILSEDVVWTNHSSKEYSPFAGSHHGVEGVKAYFGRMPEIKQDRFDIVAIAESNGYVMVTIERKATYLSVGKTHEGQIVHVLRFDQGLLVQMDIYEHR